MIEPLTIYSNVEKFPRLSIQQFAIKRAVKNLDKIEAIALIRVAYQSNDGAYTSLKEAERIYKLIMNE